jgi:hypothetical protein
VHQSKLLSGGHLFDRRFLPYIAIFLRLSSCFPIKKLRNNFNSSSKLYSLRDLAVIPMGSLSAGLYLKSKYNRHGGV